MARPALVREALVKRVNKPVDTLGKTAASIVTKQLLWQHPEAPTRHPRGTTADEKFTTENIFLHSPSTGLKLPAQAPPAVERLPCHSKPLGDPQTVGTQRCRIPQGGTGLQGRWEEQPTPRRSLWSGFRCSAGLSCSARRGHRAGSAPLAFWWLAPAAVCSCGTACRHSRWLRPSPSCLQ